MIMEYLADNPQKASLVRRLFNYYLPTLDKLLKSWQLFDEHGEGDGEWAGKSEIEEAVAEMDNVFRKQHDKLINDAARHIDQSSTSNDQRPIKHEIKTINRNHQKGKK